MIVLITGISSPLGRMLAQRLVDAHHDVIGVDRRAWRNAPPGIEMHEVDLRKRAAEDVFRKRRPQAVVHMATVTHLVARTEERYRINLGGTRALFEYCAAYGTKQAIFVGRHTYYGAAADSPLYHAEDEPPMAVTTFPELADLVAADLYATTALWRLPDLCTSVLRLCYSLGSTGQGTLASYLRGPRVPTVLGFDPLYQFMSEADMVTAIALALEKRLRGVYNVAGPPPVPLSVLIRATGRTQVPLPELLFTRALGRLGFPKLPRGAVSHIKYPVVIDDSVFRKETGFAPAIDESTAMHQFRDAYPARR